MNTTIQHSGQLSHTGKFVSETFAIFEYFQFGSSAVCFFLFNLRAGYLETKQTFNE